MKARKTIVSALALALVAGSSAMAYAGQKEGCDRADRADRKVERMARQLDLDDAQQASLKALFEDHAKQKQEGKDTHKPRATLAGLDPNAPDYQQQVKQQISEMQQKLAERVQSRADFKASLYAILTPEQEQKLAEMREQHMDGKHGRKGHDRRHEGPRDF